MSRIIREAQPSDMADILTVMSSFLTDIPTMQVVYGIFWSKIDRLRS